MTPRRCALLATLALLVCPPWSARASDDHGAHELESRLVAPCCWVQTLDIHESELATALRAEIAQRLQRGEAASAIEDDLAARYGERIRAVPRGQDPRRLIPAVIGAAMGATLLGVLVALRRWMRRERAAVAPLTPVDVPGADEYEQRLDDELARLDEG